MMTKPQGHGLSLLSTTSTLKISTSIEKTEFGDFYRVELCIGVEVFGLGRSRKALTAFRLALIDFEKFCKQEQERSKCNA